MNDKYIDEERGAGAVLLRASRSENSALHQLNITLALNERALAALRSGDTRGAEELLASIVKSGEEFLADVEAEA